MSNTPGLIPWLACMATALILTAAVLGVYSIVWPIGRVE